MQLIGKYSFFVLLQDFPLTMIYSKKAFPTVLSWFILHLLNTRIVVNKFGFY